MDNLLSQAQAVLATTPSRWQTLTATIPEALLTLEPAPGEWSALQCLRHLLDTEEKVFPVRIRAIMAGQNFPAFNPDTDGERNTSGMTPAELSAKFAAVRKNNMKLLAGLSPKDLTHTAIHAELGKVTLGELINEWIGHDLNHTVQAERAMMQPFIAGCGPWRSYFKDHDIKFHEHAK
jgi:DinB superfamily